MNNSEHPVRLVSIAKKWLTEFLRGRICRKIKVKAKFLEAQFRVLHYNGQNHNFLLADCKCAKLWKP